MTMGARLPAVRYVREGALGRLVLERPPLNILDTPMLETLEVALEQAKFDSVSLLVISGAGRGFCAGVDVAAHLPPQVKQTLELFHSVVRRLVAFEAPTVAVVHGPTLGGGCELALACDIILARDDATIGQPEIRLGVLPPVAAAILPQRIGRQRALDLILTGRTISGIDAVNIGLASRSWPADTFNAGVTNYVAELAGLSRPVLRLAKRAATPEGTQFFERRLQAAETIYLEELMKVGDSHEGLAAFLEKRAPVWKGA